MTQKFQKQKEQKQVGRIRLSDYEDLVVTVVGNERPGPEGLGGDRQVLGSYQKRAEVLSV